MLVHNLRRRKATGGRYKDVKPKRLAQRGDLPALTRIGERRVKVKRARGGNEKRALLSVDKANVLDPSTGKCVVAEVKGVVENAASRHFVRRNILTRGAIIETSKGKARITNRPGQEGFINAVLIK